MRQKNPKGMIFYLSMLISVLSVIFYQICQKSIATNINPVVSVMLSYSVAILFLFVLLFFFPSSKGFMESVREANIATYLLGFAVVGIEIGFLLVYRSGWRLGLANGFSSTITTTVLLFVGIIVFKDHISPIKIIGLVCCVVGMILVYWE